MKKIIVYLGLSILEDEAKTILDADYRPPVKRGDILKAISEKPDRTLPYASQGPQDERPCHVFTL